MNVKPAVQLPRTEPLNAQIDHPSAWTTKEVPGKESLVRVLTAGQLAAIDELLAKTRHLKPQQVTREQFDHPEITPLLKDFLNEIMNEKGAVIIRGITPDRYSEDDFERIYWGFGTHWGNAVVQSPRGDRLGHVRYVPPSKDVATRAYTSNNELYPHADSNEIVGLMCVKSAKSGGYSSLVSSLAAHNYIQKHRPDLLEPLYEGYFFTTREGLQRGHLITPYKVPLYCCVEGKVSCYYNRNYIYRAGEQTGAVPPKLLEAMKYLDDVLEMDELKIEFLLEEGEMAVWHNFTVLHSRTSYEDYEEPERKRHLLRLWLDVPNGRPMIPVYYNDLVMGV